MDNITRDKISKSVKAQFPHKLQSQLTAARARIEKLEAALREYADVTNWAPTDICVDESFFTQPGSGYEIAQTALREEAE